MVYINHLCYDFVLSVINHDFIDGIFSGFYF